MSCASKRIHSETKTPSPTRPLDFSALDFGAHDNPTKKFRTSESPQTIELCVGLEHHLNKLSEILYDIAPDKVQDAQAAFKGITDIVNVTTSKIDGLEKLLNDLMESKTAKADYEKQKLKRSLIDDRIKDLEKSERTSKILGIPFESVPKDKTELLNTFKEHVGKDGNENTSIFLDTVRNAKIRYLGREPKPYNGTKSLPVLIEFESIEKKRSFDKETRTNIQDPTFRIAYEWPSDLHKNIKDWRKNVAKFKDSEHDLTNKQILFRPNKNCTKIEILYRLPSDKKWSFFKSFLTPVNQEKSKNFGLEFEALPSYLTI